MSMTAPAKGPAAYLPGPTSTDLDLQLDLRLDKVPAGGSRVDQSVILRRNANGDYRAMVRVLANGSIRAGFARTSATGVQTVFGTDVTIPGLTYAAGETLKVRAQATGTSPTTVRVKVWKSTATEPAAWTTTATDSTAGLQVAGQHRPLAVPRLVGDERPHQGQVRQPARGGGEHAALSRRLDVIRRCAL